MTDDAELIARFRDQADESAFNLLVERHQRDVYRLAYRYAGSHEDAHDLAQEAFVRVHRGLARFRGDARFKTWLYRIVVNLGLNHVERRKRELQGRVSLDDVTLEVAPRGELDVLAEEARSELRAAISELPDRQRKTVILKVFHELRFKDVAAVMKCSVGTAKANYFHALRGLRRRLLPAAAPAQATKTA